MMMMFEFLKMMRGKTIFVFAHVMLLTILMNVFIRKI